MTTRLMDNLDDNILSEILIRLPAKTLGRLKVINKRWYSLISDPFFVNKHTSLQTNRDAVSYFLKISIRGSINQLSFNPSSPADILTETTISLGLPKESENSYGYIIASCHGLLLVKLENGCLCIFNPLTKKKQLIPPFPVCGEQLSCKYGLVFGPTSSSPPYYYNHYNVVCMVIANGTFQFQTFDRDTSCWRDSNKNTMISYGNEVTNKLICSPPVCFRGIIHWLTNKGSIIAFNLDKEESKTIEIPKSLSEIITKRGRNQWGNRSWFGVVEDEVNVVVVNHNYEIIVWVLHDYENKNWKLKRKDVLKTNNNGVFYVRPMFFDGERLVFLIQTRSKPGVWRPYWQEHNIKTGVSKSLCSSYGARCFPYISTLTDV